MVKCSPRVLNRTFAALADQTRRRILEHLAHGERCVTDLARPYSMSLPGDFGGARVLRGHALANRGTEMKGCALARLPPDRDGVLVAFHAEVFLGGRVSWAGPGVIVSLGHVGSRTSGSSWPP